MADLSVIIVNYNVAYFLEQCLHSVFRAVDGLDVEVFVVDNDSVDGSVAMVREKFPQVDLTAMKENLGFSRANNLVIKRATGRYVLLLNPDTLVEEDTFRKTVAFMDAHPDAGGLGVKMIDGQGNYLPESKRGLPTPMVAFHKIFGLSALFPKSRIFGRYHLGYLSRDEVHEIDVLSGAFMMMRKSVLDEVGLLDEEYFMYGEDIDLSYRIVLGGYKNYYFPHTRIIHYKGESTKKSSINYVFVFYRAMAIFARKHFSRRNAKTFAFLINFAIWLRAGLAIVVRFVRRALVPAIDGAAILLSVWGVKQAYSAYTGIPYSGDFVGPALIAYTAIWMLSVYLNGGYDKPASTGKILRGVGIGSLIILIVYSLLPESLRFSRAIILLGTVSTALWYVLTRAIAATVRPTDEVGKTGIVAGAEEYERISQLMGTVESHDSPLHIAPEKTGEGLSTHADRLQEIAEVYKLQTVIFSGADVSSSRIIGLMAQVGSKKLKFKIAPPESLYIIGSNSIVRGDALFLEDLNAINRPANLRRKRALDIALALVLIVGAPLFIWFQRNKGGYLRNAFAVLAGRLTWVGYDPDADISHLPRIRPGVLSPTDKLGKLKYPDDTVRKLNAVYARGYSVRNDLSIMAAGFKWLGRRR